MIPCTRYPGVLKLKLDGSEPTVRLAIVYYLVQLRGGSSTSVTFLLPKWRCAGTPQLVLTVQYRYFNIKILDAGSLSHQVCNCFYIGSCFENFPAEV